MGLQSSPLKECCTVARKHEFAGPHFEYSLHIVLADKLDHASTQKAKM